MNALKNIVKYWFMMILETRGGGYDDLRYIQRN